MAMELMFSLAQSRLPITIDDPAEIDKLRILAAADLVCAELPDVGSALQVAQVRAFTAQGRAALRMAYPETSFHFSPSGFGGLGQHAREPSQDSWRLVSEPSSPSKWDA